MIIKSMSRKSQSFHQLLKYLQKEDAGKSFTWNMYANKSNYKELVKEFMQNAKQLKNSRGKIYLYHEVLSLENSGLTQKEMEQILFDLADKYINARAKNHLVYANIHLDTNNPHIHLMISANEIESSKRLRLSKKEFAEIQSHLEIYKNTKYKELEQSRIYGKQKDKSKSKQAEQEMKHKRDKTTQKEFVKQSIQDILSKTTTNEYLKKAMQSRGFEFYTRGKTRGVSYEGKNYRLKTLGLQAEYETTLKNIKQAEARKEKRQEFKQEKTKSKSNSQEQGFSR